MYKYSKISQEKFLDYPVYSFLIAWFRTYSKRLPEKENMTKKENIKMQLKDEVDTIGHMTQ